MKKLALHIISGLHDGGAEAVLYRLCTHDNVYRHHVVSMMGPGKYGPLLASKGIPMTYLDMPQGHLTISGLIRLWRVIRAVRPDVVQTWMYHADLVGGSVARWAGCKNILWGIHNTMLPGDKKSRKTVLVARLCAHLSSSVPRRIICCAKKSRDVHSALGYDETRMSVVPNGYDLSTFRPDTESRETLRKELGIAPDAPIIGFVARFDPQKDHPNLLRALAWLRDAGKQPLCLLVGTGMDPDNTVLVRMISELGLADMIRLMGRRSDIPAIMNALDVHVMSSASEAFPNVLCEAMACGTPCVTTDVGDASLIVDKTGWVVPPRDPAALCAALSQALEARENANWKILQDAARNRMESYFTIDRMVEGYHDAWRS